MRPITSLLVTGALLAAAGCDELLGIDSHTLTSEDGPANGEDGGAGPEGGASPVDSSLGTFTEDATSSKDAPAPADSSLDTGDEDTTSSEGGPSPADGSLDAAEDAASDACAGACSPGTPHCASAGTVETCVAQAGGCPEFAAPAACPANAPACNEGVGCSVCQNGTTQCSFNGVQTCVAGAWSDVVACDPATPNCIAGRCEAPASCQASTNGTTNCGPGGSGTESCCTSLEVPGGTYYRTFDVGVDGGATNVADQASVSGYRLDRYLVTVGRFRQYLNYLLAGGALPTQGAGKHVHLNGGQGLVNGGNDGGSPYETGWNVDWNQPQVASGKPYIPATAADWNANLGGSAATADAGAVGPGAGYSTWTPSPGNQESLPISQLTWYEAYAFCIWDGGFLPSEAEWEYAAAGGSQQRAYPWGSTAPGTDYLYSISGDGVSPGTTCYYPSAGPCTAGSIANIAPVGTATLGVGLWGQLDLDGEVSGWTMDYFWPNYVNPCSDCANFSPTSGRTLRSGLYFDLVAAPTTYRGALELAGVADGSLYLSPGIGVRCARAP
jgi:sulfatase modifying factor 1